MLVCDSHNIKVQVLTTELEPVRIIEIYRDPLDIAMDDKQMMYVMENDRGPKVYDSVMASINVAINMSSLCGHEVCALIVKLVLYMLLTMVTIVWVVFTGDGQFVTLFGKDCFDDPRGVTLDKDGFVYVCHKNGLTVF